MDDRTKFKRLLVKAIEQYPDVECQMCEGKGFYCQPNGPDDSEKEFCDCKAGETLFNETDRED